MLRGPMEPILRGHLVRLFEAMMRHTGRSSLSISVRTCGGASDLLERLRDPNSTFSAYTYDRCVASISDAWPDSDVPWPDGVPRFSRADLRVKTRRASKAPKPRKVPVVPAELPAL